MVYKGVLIPKDERVIKAKESGIYTIRGSLFYMLEDGTTLRCYSKVSDPYPFKLDPTDDGARVFPNPATEDILNVETLEDLEDVQISFYDMRGTIVREFTIYKFDSRKTLKLADLPVGKYIVAIRNKNYHVLKRVFVEQK